MPPASAVPSRMPAASARWSWHWLWSPQSLPGFGCTPCGYPATAGHNGPSADPVARRHVLVRAEDDALRVAERAQDQHFRAHRPDLPRREVHDRDHQPALEGLARVVGDLGRRALDADLGAEVDGELPGGLARLGEIVDGNHAPDADVDAPEVLEGDLGPHGP